MHVRTRRAGEAIAVVTVYGRMMSGPDLRSVRKAVRKLTGQGFPWIVLDIGNVEWMNSVGLGALISGMVSCRNAGGNVVVARPTRKVRSLFMTVQVMRLFETRDTVISAIEALRAMKGAGPKFREPGWVSISSGPEDWAFVRDRLQARKASPDETQAITKGGERRYRGVRWVWRSIARRPILGLWGWRMTD